MAVYRRTFLWQHTGRFTFLIQKWGMKAQVNGEQGVRNWKLVMCDHYTWYMWQNDVIRDVSGVQIIYKKQQSFWNNDECNESVWLAHTVMRGNSCHSRLIIYKLFKSFLWPILNYLFKTYTRGKRVPLGTALQIIFHPLHVRYHQLVGKCPLETLFSKGH